MQTVLFSLVLLLLVVTQSALASLWTLGGVRVDLLPALIAYAALTTRWPLSLWLAVVGGILLDSLSANHLGVTSVALAGVTGFGVLARRLVFRSQWRVQWIVGGTACLLASLVQWALLLAGGLGWAFSFGGLARIFEVALLSLVVAPLGFRGMDRIRILMGELSLKGEDR